MRKWRLGCWRWRWRRCPARWGCLPRWSLLPPRQSWPRLPRPAICEPRRGFLVFCSEHNLHPQNLDIKHLFCIFMYNLFFFQLFWQLMLQLKHFFSLCFPGLERRFKKPVHKKNGLSAEIMDWWIQGYSGKGPVLEVPFFGKGLLFCLKNRISI